MLKARIAQVLGKGRVYLWDLDTHCLSIRMLCIFGCSTAWYDLMYLSFCLKTDKCSNAVQLQVSMIFLPCCAGVHHSIFVGIL